MVFVVPSFVNELTILLVTYATLVQVLINLMLSNITCRSMMDVVFFMVITVSISHRFTSNGIPVLVLTLRKDGSFYSNVTLEITITSQVFAFAFLKENNNNICNPLIG